MLIIEIFYEMITECARPYMTFEIIFYTMKNVCLPIVSIHNIAFRFDFIMLAFIKSVDE